MRSNRRMNLRSERLLVADATRALVPAPGVGWRIRVFAILATAVTGAAQQINVGVDGGTVAQQIFSIPASSTTPVDYWSNDGFLLPENIALSAKPAAAGPAWQFLVEYTTEPV